MSYGVTFRSGAGDSLNSADRLLRLLAVGSIPNPNTNLATYITVPTLVSSQPYWTATAIQVYGAPYYSTYPIWTTKLNNTIISIVPIDVSAPMSIFYWGY